MRAGKPDLCTYEAFPPGTRPSAGARYSAGLNDGDFGAPLSQQNDDQIRELQAEIAQLKEHLFQTSISQSNPDSYGNGDIESLPTLARVASDSGSEGQATVTSPVISPHSLVFNQRPTRTYQGSSTLIQLFYDVGLPFTQANCRHPFITHQILTSSETDTPAPILSPNTLRRAPQTSRHSSWQDLLPGRRSKFKHRRCPSRSTPPAQGRHRCACIILPQSCRTYPQNCSRSYL